MRVPVLVPADRIGAFQIALGSFHQSRALPSAAPGSTADEWRAVEVELEPADVGRFYQEFGRWLSETTDSVAPVEPAELEEAELREAWELLPRHEQEFLRLLADDFGRAVEWSELRDKLGLPAEPDLTLALPVLAAECAHRQKALPVRLTGTVVWLRPEQVDHVRAAGAVSRDA